MGERVDIVVNPKNNAAVLLNAGIDASVQIGEKIVKVIND